MIDDCVIVKIDMIKPLVLDRLFPATFCNGQLYTQLTLTDQTYICKACGVSKR